MDINLFLEKAMEDTEFTDRERKILIGKLTGDSLQHIGDHLGITRERVRQIYGVLSKRIIAYSPGADIELEENINKNLHRETVEDTYVSSLMLIYGYRPVYSFIDGFTVGSEYEVKLRKHISKPLKSNMTLPQISPLPFADIHAIAELLAARVKGNLILSFKGALYLWRPAHTCPVKLRILKMIAAKDGRPVAVDLAFDQVFRDSKIKNSSGISKDLFVYLMEKGNDHHEWGLTFKDGLISADESLYEGKLSDSETLFLNVANGKGISYADTQTLFVSNGMSAVVGATILRNSPVVVRTGRSSYISI